MRTASKPGISSLTVLALLLAVSFRSAAAADSEESYDYLLVLPFQHNYYHPSGPEVLGRGNGPSFARGPAALFDNPSRIASGSRGQIHVSSSNLSAGRSSLTVSTGNSLALPSIAAAAFKWGPAGIAAGWKRTMDTDIAFPDPRDGQTIDQAKLALEQYSVGLALSAIKNFDIGVALCLSRFDFRWNGPEGQLAEGRGTAPGLSAGITADLGQDLLLSMGFRSKVEMSCYTTFNGDVSGASLKLTGTVPQASWVSVSFVPEPGFDAMAGMRMTGWHLASSGYLEQMDYHLGCRIELVAGRLDALCGSYSLKHPLDPYLRRYDTFLQDMYFITAGISYHLGPLNVTCAGATSYPLSGKGLNQNILSAGIEYHYRAR